VLTLGLMLSEGIKVSNSTVEMAEAGKKNPNQLAVRKKCENIKYLRAITKMKSRKMKAINGTPIRWRG